MATIKFVHWQEENMWIGYLEDYPDYRTQGANLEELKENLTDIYKDISDDSIPGIRKIDTLVIG